jgi:hypothetical protein
MVWRKRRAEAREEEFIRLDAKCAFLGILRRCRGITALIQNRKHIISRHTSNQSQTTTRTFTTPCTCREITNTHTAAQRFSERLH